MQQGVGEILLCLRGSSFSKTFLELLHWVPQSDNQEIRSCMGNSFLQKNLLRSIWVTGNDPRYRRVAGILHAKAQKLDPGLLQELNQGLERARAILKEHRKLLYGFAHWRSRVGRITHDPMLDHKF